MGNAQRTRARSAREKVAAQRAAGRRAQRRRRLLLLAMAGLGVSVCETYAHFNGSHRADCPTGQGAFNCTAVITTAMTFCS
jgi:hypothetical protein